MSVIGKQLYIELADTPIKRECGLKNRKYLSKNEGMLFRFPQPHYLSFWMESTYLPLEIAFLSNDGRILQIEEMVPLSTKAIRSRKPCKYALEVNRGWFKENNIDVGCKIGGVGINPIQKRMAQMTPQVMPPTGEFLPEVTPEPIEPQEGLIEPSPDVMLNLSFKERLQDADLKGKDMVIIYELKEREGEPSMTLAPRVISPPFMFEPDENGKHDAIVKAWDKSQGGWRSFIIDNIKSLDHKNEENATP